MENYTTIQALDGYVCINKNGFHTYARKWGNGVMSIFYKYCRLDHIEPNVTNLYRYFNEIVIPNHKNKFPKVSILLK